MRLALIASLCVCGCMTVPMRYRAPQRTYQPGIEQLSVVGFERTEYRTTGSASSTVIAPQLGLYGVGVGETGEYHQASDASLMRWLLEDTHCVRVVNNERNSSLRLEGVAGGQRAIGALFFSADALEMLTLTPILGVPYPYGPNGWANARLYRDGEFTRSYSASARLTYWTTLYTARVDTQRGAALARGMALRELADQVAADLCR